MRVYFTNLGCKLNQAEVEGWAREFVAAGHFLSSDPTECDLHVVNSCTVTHVAARDSRKAVRRADRAAPRARTVLTGCFASDPGGEAAALKGVDLLIGNHQKQDLLEAVETAFPELAHQEDGGLPRGFVPFEWGHARSMLKVEDGCNMRCAFCIIPTTRGRQRSRSIESVCQEARLLEEVGFREIVITGVQISEYRDGRARLADLVSGLLGRTEKCRLRLTSIAPWRFDHRLLELFQHPRICSHVHLSLQSGSASTLKRMRRPYSPESYRQLVEDFRDAVPQLAVTTDVIVGFPGEDDSEFEQSLAFVESLEFSRPHIFPYSPRAGTPSFSLGDRIPPAVKKERAKRMREVGRVSDEQFRRRLLGRQLEVLWEYEKDDLVTGVTDNYVRVQSRRSDGCRVGKLSRITAKNLTASGIEAEPIESVVSDQKSVALRSYRVDEAVGDVLRLGERPAV